MCIILVRITYSHEKKIDRLGGSPLNFELECVIIHYLLVPEINLYCPGILTINSYTLPDIGLDFWDPIYSLIPLVTLRLKEVNYILIRQVYPKLYNCPTLVSTSKQHKHST